MILELANGYDVLALRRWVSEAEADKATVEVRRKRPARSGRQNNYLHLILGYFGCEYGASLDEVKVDYFKRGCNRDIFEREGVNRRGKAIKTLRSTRDLDTAEMTLAIERFRNWSAAVAGIYLPAPDEDAFLEHCRKEIDRNKEFV